MYYIGLDVHKKTISYCVKDAAGHVHQEGKFGSLLPRTGPGPGEGNPARKQESGHSSGGQKDGDLHARGGAQTAGFRAGRRDGGQGSSVKKLSN